MKLDLSTCSQLQATLDERIMAQHHQTRSTTFQKRILALIVEIAELANETRSFKYWSLKGPSSNEVLLEEFSDTLHFILSLGLDLGIEQPILDTNKSEKSLSELFIQWTYEATQLSQNFTVDQFNLCFTLMGQVGDALGFSDQDVINSYLQKNTKNHQRQSEAY